MTSHHFSQRPPASSSHFRPSTSAYHEPFYNCGAPPRPQSRRPPSRPGSVNLSITITPRRPESHNRACYSISNEYTSPRDFPTTHTSRTIAPSIRSSHRPGSSASSIRSSFRNLKPPRAAESPYHHPQRPNTSAHVSSGLRTFAYSLDDPLPPVSFESYGVQHENIPYTSHFSTSSRNPPGSGFSSYSQTRPQTAMGLGVRELQRPPTRGKRFERPPTSGRTLERPSSRNGSILDPIEVGEDAASSPSQLTQAGSDPKSFKKRLWGYKF